MSAAIVYHLLLIRLLYKQYTLTNFVGTGIPINLKFWSSKMRLMGLLSDAVNFIEHLPIAVIEQNRTAWFT